MTDQADTRYLQEEVESLTKRLEFSKRNCMNRSRAIGAECIRIAVGIVEFKDDPVMCSENESVVDALVKIAESCGYEHAFEQIVMGKGPNEIFSQN